MKSTKRKKQSTFFQVIRRLSKNKGAMIAMILLILLVLAAVLADFIAPYAPGEINMRLSNASPSISHPFGCDSLGRDMLSRLIYGARYSLSLGLAASSLGAMAGILLGTLAGFFGGRVENLILRLMDVLQAIPGILLCICISTVLGAGFVNTILALSVGSISGITRMLRARILSERSKEYLEAAESINCSKRRIMFKHMLPNVVSPVIVNITMSIGGTISAAAGLSFIGLGVQPPTPEWGAMLSSGRNLVLQYPHLVVFPGLCIAIVVLLINIFGDGLRDAMDPRLKK